MSNPTTGADKADSAGYFPQIYSADGVLFDILEKNASGVTIATYLSVLSLGSSTSDLYRDFTNSRFQARGAGGIVYLEGGDPIGDDVGGKLTLGGWAGTQADEIDINAVLVNVIGRLKEGGLKLPGIVQTPATTFTGAANVVIPLTNSPTGERAWDIDIIDFVLSGTAVVLSLRFSYDGGVTFSTATNYGSSSMMSSNAALTSTASSAATSALIATDIYTPANTPGAVSLRVVTPDTGANGTVATGAASTWRSATTKAADTRFSAWDQTGGRATHVQILPSTGTLSGVYRVVPLRGLGEV